jgi:hypothetical protein
MGTTSTTSTGELVVDDAAIDSTVSTYPGVTVGSNETVISKVGATRVRVQRENGTVYVRNAVAGDSVPGRMHVDNKRRIPANEFYCP